MTSISNPCCDQCDSVDIVFQEDNYEVTEQVCRKPSCPCHRVAGCKCEDDNKLTQALCPLHGHQPSQAKGEKELPDMKNCLHGPWTKKDFRGQTYCGECLTPKPDYRMKGTIATNDPHLVDVIAQAFPDWLVVVADVDALVVYYPAPHQTL